MPAVMESARVTDLQVRREQRESVQEAKAEVVQAIRRWFDLYGEPPRVRDWDRAEAVRAGDGEAIERFDRGDWPSANECKGLFGTFSAAIVHAGFYPRQRTKVWKETPDAGKSSYLREAIAALRTLRERE